MVAKSFFFRFFFCSRWLTREVKWSFFGHFSVIDRFQRFHFYVYQFLDDYNNNVDGNDENSKTKSFPSFSIEERKII